MTRRSSARLAPVHQMAWHQVRSQLRRSWFFLRREYLIRLLLITIVTIFVGTLAIAMVEPEMTVLNGLWWSIVTMTTVGYGDISPKSVGGRVIAITLMFFGIGVLGMLSASLASILVQNKLREERGLTKYRYRNHIILCEWNYRTHQILKDLRGDPKTVDQPIVLIADLPNTPIIDENLHLVAGVVNDETLQRANIAEAQTVVILGDDSLDPVARDAKVVLATLTVESVNSNVYTIVELVSDANVRHCQRASANEIIVNNNVTSGLLARATLDHGITKIITNWLSVDHDDELYKIELPSSLSNRTFMDALVTMKEQHGAIVLGVQRKSSGNVLSNPPATYQLTEDDLLIVVCSERPNIT